MGSETTTSKTSKLKLLIQVPALVETPRIKPPVPAFAPNVYNNCVDQYLDQCYGESHRSSPDRPRFCVAPEETTQQNAPDHAEAKIAKTEDKQQPNPKPMDLEQKASNQAMIQQPVSTTVAPQNNPNQQVMIPELAPMDTQHAAPNQAMIQQLDVQQNDPNQAMMQQPTSASEQNDPNQVMIQQPTSMASEQNDPNHPTGSRAE